MTIEHSIGARNAIADFVAGLVDAGSAAGYINVRAGTQASPGTILAEIPFNDPAFASASGGAVAGAGSYPIQDAAADATGTAGMFEVCDSDDNVIFTGTVTATGGGGDMTLGTVSIVSGGPVQITAASYTAPA